MDAQRVFFRARVAAASASAVYLPMPARGRACLPTCLCRFAPTSLFLLDALGRRQPPLSRDRRQGRAGAAAPFGGRTHTQLGWGRASPNLRDVASGFISHAPLLPLGVCLSVSISSGVEAAAAAVATVHSRDWARRCNSSRTAASGLSAWRRRSGQHQRQVAGVPKRQSCPKAV